MSLYGSKYFSSTKQLIEYLDEGQNYNKLIRFEEYNDLPKHEVLELCEVINSPTREAMLRSEYKKELKTLFKGFLDTADLIIIALDCIDIEIEPTSKLAKKIK